MIDYTYLYSAEALLVATDDNKNSCLSVKMSRVVFWGRNDPLAMVSKSRRRQDCCLEIQAPLFDRRAYLKDDKLPIHSRVVVDIN